jgi:succinyl-diaminopimelate desuccinylase
MTATPIATDTDLRSTLQLLTDLVRAPSRGGIDAYAPVVDITEGWLTGAGLTPRVLAAAGQPVAVLCDIGGGEPGPHYVLDACLDTADLGDPTAWTRDPFGAEVVDGWMYGRGTSDSKAAVAVFCHLAARLATQPLPGKLSILFDLDEHTGGFAGIRTYLDTPAASDIAGVMIGYPGPDKVVIGGRGFLRARVTVFGKADHSAARHATVSNAIVRATQLVAILDNAVPQVADPDFGLPPKLTVTSIRGGSSGVYSVVPDRCEIEVDVRLTPTFDADTAWQLLGSAVAELDALYPAPRDSRLDLTTQAWPPFQLPADHPLPAAVIAGARTVGLAPVPTVAGPSNIGNLLAAHGIPATAGFGVRYRNLHGTDEAIEVASIPPIQAAYEHAIRALLTRPSRPSRP